MIELRRAAQRVSVLSRCRFPTVCYITDVMTTSFKLRPYQKAAVLAVMTRYLEQNMRRMLLYLPTGAGKTVIATFIIKELLARTNCGRVLFVAHRREILNQTARTMREHLPGCTIEIEQGERTSAGEATITVASVQSLVRRKERFDPKAFSVIVCDECHRALAPSWGEVIDYFVAEKNSTTLLLGMTATPRRTDGRSALDVFGDVAFEISRSDIEDLGYLVPMQYFTVQSDLQLDKVKLSAGDFQVNALSRVMDTPEVRALTLKAWLEAAQGKKTIAFCAGVEHAHHLAEDFAAFGKRAGTIDGKTKDRDELLKAFAEGGLDVLTNYGVLTEGFDDPSVECILMARPTTSPLVYTQCVGRGLRTAPGKTGCTVIDVIDRSTHELQYGAYEMAGLSRKWRCRGGNPFRQARSLAGIKVTSPEAFLRIRAATSIEEVQAILMSLPPNVVVAGLDGEPVLHYKPLEESGAVGDLTRAALALLRQAGVRGAKISVQGQTLLVSFREPETENERWAYLKWHLQRVTGFVVIYEESRRRALSNPRALLRSMLPSSCHINAFSADLQRGRVTANITGLTKNEIADIAKEFEDAMGMAVDLKGQLSLL